MANALKIVKDSEGKNVPARYRLEFWVGEDGDIEDQAFAYPILTRPLSGALPKQEASMSILYSPSEALKSLLKTEQKAVVDIEVAR